MTHPTRILVFGRSGQMARALASLPGLDVQCLGREDADLTVPGSCAARIRATNAELVINAAAYTNVDGAETERDLAYRINAVAPAEMAEAARERGLPFVSVSTDYVFDGSGTDPWLPDAPINPLGVYGASKADGERRIIEAGGMAAVLRTSWVFSATGSNFVKTMIRLGESREHLSVVDDQIGGPTEAEDLARAAVALGQSLAEGRATSGIYHFAGAPDASWADFAKEIFTQTGQNVTVAGISTAEYPARPAQRPLNSRLDCTSFSAATDMPRPEWKTSLARVLSKIDQVSEQI